jgi:hypothetical protein
MNLGHTLWLSVLCQSETKTKQAYPNFSCYEHLERKYYIVDVETFADPVCVVHDMGGKSNAFLRMLPRSGWLESYQKWLNSPHEKVSHILQED